jgi:hypothetical protein
MEVKMNKEIRDYQESMFMGLDLRQCVCSVLAILTAIGIYFGMRDITGQEITGWLCVLGAAPFAAWLFQISWYDSRTVFMGSDQIRIAVSEETGVSVGRYLLFLHAGDHLAGRKESKGWSGNHKRAGAKSRSKTEKETQGKE